MKFSSSSYRLVYDACGLRRARRPRGPVAAPRDPRQARRNRRRARRDGVPVLRAAGGHGVVRALRRAGPSLCHSDRLFAAQFRVDFHRAQTVEREALCAEFNRAAGAQTALDAFDRLAAGEPTGRADFGHSIPATKQSLKQRMYQQMATAAVLRESSSRYVACKRRLGVIEVLKPWVQSLPTPPESSEEDMARAQQVELLKLRQEHEDHFEEAALVRETSPSSSSSSSSASPGSHVGTLCTLFR